MKILLTFSIFFIILFSAILAFAIFSNNVTEIESEITVDAPASVIYNLLSNYQEYPTWSPMIQEIHKSEPSNEYLTTYHFAEKTITIHEKIQYTDTLNQISTQQTAGQPRAFLGNIKNQISINALSDGTTVVIWKFKYQLFSIGNVLVNPFFIRPEIEKTVASNIKALQEYLER